MPPECHHRLTSAPAQPATKANKKMIIYSAKTFRSFATKVQIILSASAWAQGSMQVIRGVNLWQSHNSIKILGVQLNSELIQN